MRRRRRKKVAKSKLLKNVSASLRLNLIDPRLLLITGEAMHTSKQLATHYIKKGVGGCYHLVAHTREENGVD